MKDELLAALVELRRTGPRTPSLGICGNIPIAGADVYLQVRFSEMGLNPAYPVPGYDGFSAVRAFQVSGATIMWSRTHPYGIARWKLLDRLIKHLGGDV